MSDAITTAAHEYMELGLSVIALTGKAPNGRVHPHGLKDAFTKDSRTGWLGAFTHRLTTGVGILTNYPYFVVDIDGEEGAKEWAEIAGADFLPSRWVARTGRGLHLWYADVQPRRTRKLAPQLDLKALGGYVAAPPSKHPDGHVYEWLWGPSLEEPPMEAPDGLRRVLDDGDREMEGLKLTRQQAKHIVPPPQPGNIFVPTFNNFGGVLKAVRDAGEGNRNRALYWAAYTLVEEGAFDEDFDDLFQAGVDAGLTRRETRLTIRSARLAAKGV